MKHYKTIERLDIATIMSLVFIITFLHCCGLVDRVWGLNNGTDSQRLVGHLGGEYKSIANSLVSGQGFSAAFGNPEIPTAWTAPLIPGALAGLHLLCFQNWSLTAECVTLIHTVIICGCAVFFVLSFDNKFQRILVAACFAALLIGEEFLWFGFSHDHVIGAALTTALWGIRLRNTRRSWRTKHVALLGAMTGAVTLAMPVVGFTFFVCFLVELRCRMTSVAVLVAFTALPLLPWTIRNFVVLNEPVPVKSNLWFEAWQSQVLDGDGLLDSELIIQKILNVSSCVAICFLWLSQRIVHKRAVIATKILLIYAVPYIFVSNYYRYELPIEFLRLVVVCEAMRVVFSTLLEAGGGQNLWQRLAVNRNGTK